MVQNLATPAWAKLDLGGKGARSAVGTGVSLASAVAGIGLMISAFVKFKQHKDNPTQISGLRAVGGYLIFQFAPAPPTPVAFGELEADEFGSYTAGFGTFGPFEAGILEFEVSLHQKFPSQDIIPATLRMVSNIHHAGIATAEEGGFTLTIPGSPLGTFEPVALVGDPISGLITIPIAIAINLGDAIAQRRDHVGEP
jgi:hypothetical protein